MIEIGQIEIGKLNLYNYDININPIYLKTKIVAEEIYNRINYLEELYNDKVFDEIRTINNQINIKTNRLTSLRTYKSTVYVLININLRMFNNQEYTYINKKMKKKDSNDQRTP